MVPIPVAAVVESAPAQILVVRRKRMIPLFASAGPPAQRRCTGSAQTEGVPSECVGALVSELPACAAGALSLSFDENGSFAGMSHDGTLMVLRNIGPPCRVAALPHLSFTDRNGKQLPISFEQPVGMHPGPAVPPVGIATDAEVTAGLLWVSGDVYDHGRCFEPARITVAFDEISVTQKFEGGRMCGPSDAPATYQQQWLKPDARLHR